MLILNLGLHTHLYKKPVEKRYLQQQAVLAEKKEAKRLERMSGTFFKKLKLERFVDPPFIYYHPFIKKPYLNE